MESALPPIQGNSPGIRGAQASTSADNETINPASSKSQSMAYRIRGIPLRYDESQVRQLLKEILGLDNEYSKLNIRSLAVDATKPSHRVAVVDFQRIPIQLRDEHSNPNITMDISFVDDNDGHRSKNGRLLIDTKFIGMTTLAAPSQPHKVDIIVMSGLGGHAFGSFKQRGGDFMWLCDSIPLELPGARVLIYGSDTHLHNSHSFQDFEALGGTFRENLQIISSGKEKFVPKIFIGHSLGGLIIKEAMIQMNNLKDPILDVVRGVFFFGVPNQGMEIKSLIPIVKGQPNQLLLHSLGTESQLLRNQCRDFEKSLHFRDIDIACFYETAESRTAQQDNFGNWKMTGPYETLVGSASARHGREWETCSAINKSHSDMVKFDPDDNDYQRVLHKLQQLIETIKLVGYGSRPLKDIEKECLRSLHFPEMDIRQKDIHHPAEKTCEWIFNNSTFNDWKLGKHNLLWIKGKPGAGKSTLLKHIFSNAEDTVSARQNTLILSFFFHGRGSTLEKTPFGLYQSLMHQLLQKCPDMCTSFVKEYQKKVEYGGSYGERWAWQPSEIQELFEEALKKVLEAVSVRIFIDALDECGEESAIELVGSFNRMVSIENLRRLKLSFCFSCRHYPILSFNKKAEICVEDQNFADIETFLRQDLAKVNFYRVEEICDTICQNARGIFQWAVLVSKKVLQLKRRGKNTEFILREIKNIPQDLEDLYRNLFESLPPAEKDETLRLMCWICFAIRPMTLNELRYALVFQSDNPPISIEMCQMRADFAETCEDMELKLTYLSRGLAETRQMHNKLAVQFIHQSVQDFFQTCGINLLQGNTEFPDDYNACNAHFMLSQACVNYIAANDVSPTIQNNEKSNLPAKYSYDSDISQPSEASISSQDGFDFTGDTAHFLEYSTLFWIKHVNQSQNTILGIPKKYAELTKKMQIHMNFWIKVYSTMDLNQSHCPAPQSLILHIISRYGLLCLLSDNMLNELENEFNSKDDDGMTPLSWAAKMRQEAVVKLLVNTDKVDVNCKDLYHRTPLLWAVENGYITIVKLLLDIDTIDAHCKDDDGRTPLWCAIMCENTAIVKLFLDTGKVDIDPKDNMGMTPLWLAAHNGCTDIVKLFLDTSKVDVNSEDIEGKTPLWLAVDCEYTTIVKLLLDTGKVDVNSEDIEGRTPLWLAVEYGYTTIVKLLLDTGKVDFSSKDFESEAPLSQVAQMAYEAMKLCDLDKFEVDSTFVDAQLSLLSLAAESGYNVIVKLLLDTGKVDADGKHTESWKPLHYAAKYGYGVIIELLLDNGANINIQTEFGSTALDIAISNRQEDTEQLLLAYRASSRTEL